MLIENAVVVQIVMSRSIFLCSDGVSTWTKFDDHIYLKNLRFKMYYGSALALFTRKVHCLQTFEHMSALWAIKV